jgi:hypothetical protein
MESDIQMQQSTANPGRKTTNENQSRNEFDIGNEDLILMNIPKEGNADQLNKSTKLTLSSKKQYENHLQNKSINNSNTNQYMLSV